MSADALTLTEAGYVLNRPATALNRAVDTGVIRARHRKVGTAVQRMLGPAEMRFLLVAHRLDKDLTPAGRKRLYEAIRRLSVDAHRVTLGELVLDLGKIDADLKSRMQRLGELRKWVDTSAGEPLIKGSKVPAHMVAALARTQSVNEIVEDFPSLSAEQVEAAIEYAKAYPKRGRPYPTRSLKRSLGHLANLGAFDLETASTDAAPRVIP